VLPGVKRLRKSSGAHPERDVATDVFCIPPPFSILGRRTSLGSAVLTPKDLGRHGWRQSKEPHDTPFGLTQRRRTSIDTASVSLSNRPIMKGCSGEVVSRKLRPGVALRVELTGLVLILAAHASVFASDPPSLPPRPPSEALPLASAQVRTPELADLFGLLNGKTLLVPSGLPKLPATLLTDVWEAAVKGDRTNGMAKLVSGLSSNGIVFARLVSNV